MPMANDSRAAHLLSRTRTTEYGCMEFTGCIQANGYSRATVKRKADYGHRHVYRLVKGEIPAGLDVMHTCDNRCCINPEHLVLGTRLENMRDAVSKDRQARGVRHPHTKINSVAALEIAAAARQGTKYRDVAIQFGICRQHAGFIAIQQGVRRRGISK